jgi:hypothetical protein
MTLFVARQMSCGRMRGRRHESSRWVVPALCGGLAHAENKADGRRAAAAVEDDSWMGSRAWKG